MFRRSATGANGSSVRARNISAILLTLLHNDGVSRVQLANQIGVSTTTITKLATDLIEQGLVVEEGNIASDQRSVGRPRKALFLVPTARYALAIHINVGYVRLAITDLQGEALHIRNIDYDTEQPAIEVLAQTITVLREMLDTHEIDLDDVVGAGIAASGLVNPFNGEIILAPNQDWHEVPLGEYFSQELRVPVAVDNNVRAMALGEALFGLAQNVNSVAFVYSRIGIGAGLVVGGELYRGAGGAGEIGHTTIILHGGEKCRCGNRGCLETLVSERVIIRVARQLAGKYRYRKSILSQMIDRAEHSTIQNIFDAAREGDEETAQMLRKRAEYMGVGLANLVNVFNPELIVLGGTFAEGADLLLPTVEKTIRERAFANLGEKVQVQATQFRDEGLTGAAALALDAFFYRYRPNAIVPAFMEVS